jgi:hypothetical protein
MAPTPTTLTRAAGVAAVLAGLIFIGVQINHPVMDPTSITSTEVVLRNSAKALMAVLALIGITGMYLRQVRQVGVLGVVGYVVLGAGYLVMTATTLIAATVLPAVAGTDPAYVSDVIAAATGNTPEGDIGALQTVFRVQDLGYLVGGLVFGIALYRARVLARWAAALLAVGGLVSIALSVMPDAFYRFLAFPNGIAMVALGCSLWLTTRSAAAVPEPAADSAQLTATGAE